MSVKSQRVGWGEGLGIGVGGKYVGAPLTVF